ncbi:MAG: hypothetical protein ACR2JV_04695 [Gaiellales bacterium]
MNLAPQQREQAAMGAQEAARAHPRGRVWWTLPPVLRTGRWRRIRAPDED